MDNCILQKANSLVKGQGDGRISEDDIKQILNLLLHSSEISNKKIETLLYIYTNFNLTDTAKKYIINFFGASIRSSYHKSEFQKLYLQI